MDTLEKIGGFLWMLVILLGIALLFWWADAPCRQPGYECVTTGWMTTYIWNGTSLTPVISPIVEVRKIGETK